MNPTNYPTTDSHSDANPGAVPDFERLLRILREPLEPNAMTDGSSGHYGFQPAKIDSDFWRLGWTDGRIESDSRHVEGLCRSRAAETHRRIAYYHEERRAEAKSKRQALEKQENELSSDMASIAESRQLGSRQEVSVPFLSSKAFGYLLLLMASILCLCDLPLSWNMGTYGFGLPKEVCVGPAGDGGQPQLRAGTLKSPCKPGEEVAHGIEGLLSWEGLDYLRILWPTFLLTLVLVAAALSAKVWFDITRSTGQSLWRAAAPLGLFVVTAFCLAEFRYQVEYRVPEPATGIELTMSLPMADQEPVDSNVPEAATAAVMSPAQIREEALRTVRGQALPHAGIVLLPIVLPLFAGFALSAGLSILRFPQVRRQLDEQLAATGSKLAKVREDLAKQSAIENISNDELARLREELGPERIAEVWRSVYEHGYERGRVVHSSLDAHPTSLYKTCLHKVIRLQGQRGDVAL